MKKTRKQILPTRNNHLGGGILDKRDQPDGLTKFKKNSKQKKMIIGSIVGLIVLVGGITLYRTFALYEEKKEFNVLRGKVPEFTSGDITIAAIIDGEASSIIPGKEDGYVFESITCNNGADAEWDNEQWGMFIKKLTTSKTTCTISFKSKETIPTTGSFSEYITKLSSISDELVYDETVDNNLRYIGANPNNYVTFNNELWRIIGVMNNIKDSNGNTGSHIKLIRYDKIGGYSWDNKASGTGSSTSENGSNDWTDSALMNVLNKGAYWNRTSGTCPYPKYISDTSCDFTNTGLTNDAKSMVANVVWKLGGSSTYTGVTTNMYYERERGTEVYSGRPTEWTGNIGLIYPSDYGYATSGGSTTSRDTCLNTNLSNWDNTSVSDCRNNDWLYSKNFYSWTLTSGTSNSDFGIYISSTGYVRYGIPSDGYYIYPVLYLDSKVEITSGEGSQENPFQIGIGE